MHVPSPQGGGARNRKLAGLERSLVPLSGGNNRVVKEWVGILDKGEVK